MAVPRTFLPLEVALQNCGFRPKRPFAVDVRP